MKCKARIDSGTTFIEYTYERQREESRSSEHNELNSMMENYIQSQTGDSQTFGINSHK